MSASVKDLFSNLLEQHLIKERRCENCGLGTRVANSSWVMCGEVMHVWTYSCERWVAKEEEKK